MMRDRTKSGLWAKGEMEDSRAILGVKSTGSSDKLTPDVSKGVWC